MTAPKALDALKEGKTVSWTHGYPFFYRMFQHDVIMLMKMETSCAAREVERLTEESFLTRGEVSEFVIYDN